MTNLMLEKSLGNKNEFFDDDPKCTFCGKVPTGAWHVRQTVYVCVSCATTILPKLIADATLFPYRNDEKEILKAIKFNFMKGLACIFKKRLDHKEKIEKESCNCGNDHNQK